MTERAIFAGWGGQGMMTLGKLLASVMMEADKHVTYFPSYGAEVRGGTAHCHVVISDDPIHSPVVESADSLILMNEESYQKFRGLLRSGGLLVLNTSLIEDRDETDAHVVRLPASDAANELGNVLVANIIMLGAYNAARRLATQERVFAAIDQALTGRKANLRELNYRAYIQGESLGREQAGG